MIADSRLPRSFASSAAVQGTGTEEAFYRACLCGRIIDTSREPGDESRRPRLDRVDRSPDGFELSAGQASFSAAVGGRIATTPKLKI